MPGMIEALEHRTLFTTVLPIVLTDMANVRAADNTLVAHLNAGTLTYKTDLNALTRDLQRLNSNAANSGLLATLKTQGNSSLNTLKSDINGLAATISREMSKLLTDFRRVLRNPINTVAGAALQNDVLRLETDGPALQQKLTTDATSADQTKDADFAKIGSANPSDTQTQTDVAKATTDSQALVTEAKSDLMNVAAALQQLFKPL